MRDMMNRTIIHIDMDAFFASVEQHDNPSLRGRPVAVGAAGDERGVVAAASYEAREYGVRSAMPSSEAARRCPELEFVKPRRARYQAVSASVFMIFDRYTPYVEPLSIDEAFLDVTGAQRMFGDGEAIAEKIRSDIRRETGLTASAGVAANKFLAKLASDMNKPDGVTVVPRARAELMAFLRPLSTGRIWGVGAVMEQRLQAAGLVTIGDVQDCRLSDLESIAGRHAASFLKQLAFGDDERPVEVKSADKSISREHTFSRDMTDMMKVEGMLKQLTMDVGRRLRQVGLYAGVAKVKLRWQGFKTVTRQVQLDEAVCDDFSLREAALRLLKKAPMEGPIRLIGFGVSDLQPKPVKQLQLFDMGGGDHEKRERLSRSVDALRERFSDAFSDGEMSGEE